MTRDNTEDVSNNRRLREQEDSIMAVARLEDRLRRLEDAHTASDCTDTTSALICKGSKQQISILGGGFNDLDEAIHNLEQANNRREERVRKIEQLNLTCAGEEPHGTFVEKVLQMASQRSVAMITDLRRETESHQVALDLMSTRVSTLEQNQPPSLSSFDTHDVAQDLLRRLGNGDKLGDAVQRQIHASLGVNDILPLAQAPTNTSRGKSAKSAATDHEPALQSASTGSLKRKMNLPGGHEAMPKPKHSRISIASSESSAATILQPKRGRGRPPIHGRYARRSSSSSHLTNSSSSVPIADVKASSLTDGRKSVPRNLIAANTATVVRAPNDVKRCRTISGSPNGEPLTTSPDHDASGSAAHLLDGTKGTAVYNGSNEQARVSMQAGATTTPSSNRLTANATDFATRSKILRTPSAAKQRGPTPNPREDTSPRGGRVRVLDSDSTNEASIRSSPGYRDMEIPELVAMEGGAVESLYIPPERRSARKPKTAKLFGDMLSWKEASAQVDSLRP